MAEGDGFGSVGMYNLEHHLSNIPTHSEIQD